MAKKKLPVYEIYIEEKSAIKRRAFIETFGKNGYSRFPKTGLICDDDNRELHLIRKNIKVIIQWKL